MIRLHLKLALNLQILLLRIKTVFKPHNKDQWQLARQTYRPPTRRTGARDTKHRAARPRLTSTPINYCNCHIITEPAVAIQLVSRQHALDFEHIVLSAETLGGGVLEVETIIPFPINDLLECCTCGMLYNSGFGVIQTSKLQQ